MGHEVPPQAGNNHPTGIPTGVFETKDGHINIAAAGDEIYSRFCRAIERPDLLTDPRFSTAKARSTNRDLMMDVLMPVTRKKASAEWIAILNEAGVPVDEEDAPQPGGPRDEAPSRDHGARRGLADRHRRPRLLGPSARRHLRRDRAAAVSGPAAGGVPLARGRARRGLRRRRTAARAPRGASRPLRAVRAGRG